MNDSESRSLYLYNPLFPLSFSFIGYPGGFSCAPAFGLFPLRVVSVAGAGARSRLVAGVPLLLVGSRLALLV